MLRKCAQKNCRRRTEKISVSGTMVKSLLGPKVKPTFISRTDSVGIANGLAWTSVGGEMLPVEVAVIPNGTGKIEITGSLGDVMKKRSTCCHLCPCPCRGSTASLPMLQEHRPAHPRPEVLCLKDGPSAGVTLSHGAGLGPVRHPGAP